MQHIWWEWRIVHRSITLLMWKSREFPGHKTWGIQKQNKKTTANAKVEIWFWIIAKCDGHLYVFILFLSCTFYFEYNNHSIILKCTLHSVPAVFLPQTKISADRCGTDRMWHRQNVFFCCCTWNPSHLCHDISVDSSTTFWGLNGVECIRYKCSIKASKKLGPVQEDFLALWSCNMSTWGADQTWGGVRKDEAVFGGLPGCRPWSLCTVAWMQHVIELISMNLRKQSEIFSNEWIILLSR